MAQAIGGNVENDPKTGKQSTSMTDANIENTRQSVYSNRRLVIRIMADEFKISKERVRTISMEKLGMQNVCAKMVPRLLTLEQKARPPSVRQDILQQLGADNKLL